MKKNIIVKLGLRNKSDAALALYCKVITDNVNANAAFAAVTPTCAAVLLAIKDFELAKLAQKPGDKESTLHKNDLRTALVLIFVTFVSEVVFICDGDLTVLASTGLTPRAEKHKVTFIAAPDFTLVAGSAGQIIIRNRKVKNGLTYNIYVGETVDNMELKSSQSASRMYIDGLVPGKAYFVSLKAVGNNNLESEMSQTQSQRCM